MRLLVVGISTRAAAASARRSGLAEVVGLDYFGDRDQRRDGDTCALGADFGLPRSPESLVQAAAVLRYDAVAYTSSLENHPDLVARLAAGGGGPGTVLLGNAPRTLARVRHVPSLARVCRRAGIAFPETVLRAPCPPDGGPWLRKPRAAGGGHGIVPWLPGSESSSRASPAMLQRTVPGRPFSTTFIANGREAIVVGLAEGLAGLSRFGVSGFTYCGNLVPPRGDAAHWIALLPRLQTIASALTRAFGLVGLNGIDLIAGPDGGVTLLEINPRYSASMELIERWAGLPLFAWHVRAITTGTLPATPDLAGHLAHGTTTWGKAIVYARRDSVAPDTDPWLARGVRDVPHSSEAIPTGAPICTLVAGTSGGADACLAELTERALWIERSLEQAGPAQHRPAARPTLPGSPHEVAHAAL